MRAPRAGQSLLRNEDPLFLTGQATYVQDLIDPLLDGSGHAVFVRSLYAHAELTSVETADAAAAPGVLAVLSGDQNPITPTGPYAPGVPARFTQPLLAVGKARFVGEPIAVVVAKTREQAVDAAELVVVDYNVLTPVLSIGHALDGDPILFESGDPNEQNNVVLTAATDGVETSYEPATFEAADVLVRERFVNPRQLAAPIECHGAAAAWSEDGHIHLWSATQRPHKIRDNLAALYQMEPSSVHVIAGPFVGGGFGGKGAPAMEEQLLPHLARLAGRPVRWTATRTEDLTSAVHGRGEEIEMWLAGSSTGRLEALRVELAKDAGAYPSAGVSLPNNYSQPMLNGTYDIGHVEFGSAAVVTNKPPVAALRGAGRAPLVAALERAVDLYANQIGMDPAEVRRMNLIRPAEMPYTTPTGGRYDDADYVAALDRVLEIANYQGLRAEQLRRRESGERIQLGVGISSFNHRTCGGGSEQAIISINADGSATVATGTTSQGHGHAVTWAQIASDELGIPMNEIQVVEGVTDAIATGVGAVGSRSLQTAGMAVHEASEVVVATARIVAANLFEAAEADVVLDKERSVFHVAGTPARSLGWAELAREGLAQDRELSCDYVYDPDGKDVYPSGCHVAVVAVDIETGAWGLVQYTAVDDAGVRVNPMIVEGQLHGGIALGIAQVLGEEVVYDDAGNPLTSSFLDYQIASIDQFCQFELEAQVVPSSFNEKGYKAVGESGPIGATPAVHNAVVDAVSHLGVRHIDIPCTPERVWQAMQT